MAGHWMPREQWDALIRGEGCPMCAGLRANIADENHTDEYGVTVTQLDMSVLRLSSNQYAQGYSVLICKKHAREPYELEPGDAATFFADMVRAGQALETVYGAIKMNFQILGNALPHLHAHIIPRYYGDEAPGTPLDPLLHDVRLAPEVMLEKVAAIRAALATIS